MTREVLLPRSRTADQGLNQHPLCDDRVVRALSGSEMEVGTQREVEVARHCGLGRRLRACQIVCVSA